MFNQAYILVLLIIIYNEPPGGFFMVKIREGDIVGRKSHDCDLYFKVVAISTGEDGIDMAMLKGIDKRLIVYCPVEDMVKIEDGVIEAYWQQVFARNIQQVKEIIRRQEHDNTDNLARALGKINDNHD
jgi:spore coat assembly protein